VQIARGELVNLLPGASVELVMPVSSRARYHLRHHRVTKATGYIDNSLRTGGMVTTTLEVVR